MTPHTERVAVPCSEPGCLQPVILVGYSEPLPTQSRHARHGPPHQHAFQPAGLYKDPFRAVHTVFGLCPCGEITAKQWDHDAQIRRDYGEPS